MASAATAYLAIDAGGTFLKSAVLDADWEIIPGSELSVGSDSDASLEKILGAFEEIIASGIHFINKNGMKAGGIGVAFPGPFEMEKAKPLMKHKFQSIYGLDLRQCFQAFPIVPEKLPIHFIHDANAVLMSLSPLAKWV